MSQLSPAQLLRTAIQHHQAGQFTQAETIYRQLLAQDPQNHDALHLLGVLAYQLRHHDAAANLIRRAIALKPNFPEAYSNLGNVLKDLHQPDEAIAAYRQALTLKPGFADAHNNLGTLYKELRRFDDALAEYQQALALEPNVPDFHSNLGAVLKEQGRFTEAVAACQKAIALNPGYAQAYSNLGAALQNLGQIEEARAACAHAITLNPQLENAHYNLACALQHLHRYDEAYLAFSQALALNPTYAEAKGNLGNSLRALGRIDEAITSYRRALAMNPTLPEIHGNLVYALQFHPASDARAIFEEHQRWNNIYAAPLAKAIVPHTNDRSPNRRLRIGYVSPDFRFHSVGLNLLPLFREHSHANFEIFCYANTPAPDSLTEYFQSHSDVWRNIVGLSDPQLADLVRADQIDILVDLTLHLEGSRLLAFARKPAPVQVTFAGYPGTTGLTTIDYRLTDPYLDPPGLFDDCYSEKSLRLPDTFWCYDPHLAGPSVNPLPALAAGSFIFGCLNNFCKTNDQAFHLWARVMNAVPRSRLILLCDPGSPRQRVADLFQADGITPGRVQFVPYLPRPDYLQVYHSIDLCLDTLPYNGHTTSLDSYWMGVPVITLVGQTVVGRAGLSQLTNLGLTELVAHTPDQFVQIASDLAQDLPRLAQLRASLRQRMQNSPLLDAPRFAHAIESAYRTMWQRYCAS